MEKQSKNKSKISNIEEWFPQSGAEDPFKKFATDFWLSRCTCGRMRFLCISCRHGSDKTRCLGLPKQIPTG